MHNDPTRGSRSPADVRLDVNVGRIVPAAPRDDEPFRIALIGGFRGHRAVEAGAALARRAPVAVDRDDFDDVLAAFAPELRIAFDEGAPPLTLRFAELDDFHPDRIYDALPLFRSLRELRRRLADPSTFAAAARELWGTPPVPAAAPTAEAPAAAAPSLSTGGLLDEILGAPAGAAPAAPRRDDLADYIRRLVAPHTVAGADARQPEALAQVDAAIGAQMRAILHHPEFQALEALWRGVYLLVRRLETDARLRLHLVDVSHGELAADLASEHELGATGLYRLLVEPSAGTFGGKPWAVLAGCYTFGPRPEEIRQLRRLGQLAQHAGAPWISAADPRLVGATSFGATPDPDDWTVPAIAEWDELRSAPEAASIGLCLPRFLLRLPYGAQSDACERFAFEEADGRPDPEAFLWGNPAMACALLLGESFAADGWEMRPGSHREIGRLPLHLMRDGPETTALPCAEATMSERAAGRIADAGIMPLATLKGRDAVLLVRFQSLARPTAPLAGRWALAGRG